MVMNQFEFSIIQGMNVHEEVREKLLGKLQKKNRESNED